MTHLRTVQRTKQKRMPRKTWNRRIRNKKQEKSMEKERKSRAKEMKRALNLFNDKIEENYISNS